MSAGKVRQRNKSAEQHWLLLAELEAGQSGFARHALMRLAAGERNYGDRWATRPVEELLGELSEEAADLGAWGVLALQALRERSNGPAASARRIADLIEAAVACGAQAHAVLIHARRRLAECDELATRDGRGAR